MKKHFKLALATLVIPLSANASYCEIREISELQLMNEVELSQQYCTQAAREYFSSSAYDRSVKYQAVGRPGEIEEKRTERDECRRAVSNIELVYRNKFNSALNLEQCKKN